MSQYTLTIVDTSGIQEYIFGTNNLKQQIGASYLVACATQDWPYEIFEEDKSFRHNFNLKDMENPYLRDRAIEKGDLDAEVVYSGGGNLVVIFADPENAVEFTRQLTTKVLDYAPGLRVVISHLGFNWKHDALGGKGGIFDQAFAKLAERKASLPVSIPLPGLGVTVECIYTGLPTVAVVDGKSISVEVEAKLAAVDKANKRLGDFIGRSDFALDFDDMGGSKGEKNYIAVVHTDGNGMGARIARIRDNHPRAEQNRDYINKLRAFSISIQKAARDALQDTVDTLIRSIADPDIRDRVGSSKLLQFRPLIFGGDDLTFVTEGRLGLSLAARYLQAFSEKELDDKEPVYCRAGVAVVKSHFPFSRAYDLAEELARSAKDFIRNRDKEGRLTAIDWHFATSGPLFDLTTIRNREYQTLNGSLLLRPVWVAHGREDWRSWNNFKNAVTEFDSGSEWHDRHNKVKALRSALRDGPSAVDNFLKNYHAELPQSNDLSQNGWREGRCTHFDAVEAVDFFIPLVEARKRKETV